MYQCNKPKTKKNQSILNTSSLSTTLFYYKRYLIMQQRVKNGITTIHEKTHCLHKMIIPFTSHNFKRFNINNSKFIMFEIPIKARSEVQRD